MDEVEEYAMKLLDRAFKREHGIIRDLINISPADTVQVQVHKKAIEWLVDRKLAELRSDLVYELTPAGRNVAEERSRQAQPGV